MKAIIFDVDNTLIKWLDEFINPLKEALEKYGYNYNEEEILKIDSCIEKFDKENISLSINNVLNYINTNCEHKISKEVLEKVIELSGQYNIYEDKELIDVICYLSKKYDLYVISNWFTSVQLERLKRMHIYEYFKEIYGADINYKKPSKEALKVILNKYDASDCIFIGDSYENDIRVPLEVGMSAVLISKEDNKNCKTIKELKELKELL